MVKNNPIFVVKETSKLLDFLVKHLLNISIKNIKSLVIRGDIVVNNKAIKDFNYKLVSGDKVIVKMNKIYDRNFKISIDILYEDDEIIVINKPAGLLTISTENIKEKTAYHIVMNYIKRKNQKNRIFIIHRLDRDTSGVLVIAKNIRIKNLLQEKWNNIVKVRSYIAIVEGQIKKDEDTIKTWLKETTTQMVYSSYQKGDGKEAITHYQKIKSNNKYTLLNVKIDTGRKNQIRVHMNDIGHSIIGDKKYGSKVNPLKRLGLHANLLEYVHPLTRKNMHFEAELPDEFYTLF